MKEKNFNHIECNSIRIATTVEVSNCSEHNVYYPNHALLNVQQGQFHFRFNKQLISIAKGNFCLVRKHTCLSCFKTWDEEEDGFRAIIFILNDEFVERVSMKLPVLANGVQGVAKPFLTIPSNAILVSLMNSLEVYFSNKQDIDPDIVELKTLESLIGLAQSNSNIVNYLNGVSRNIKADLPVFMEHYFNQNIPLTELARLSGRSIAGFHREFKSIFNSSPHRWIRERRLIKAKELLLNTSKKPSEIYIGLGFEDLAHFSRSFKQFFGQNPSEISALSA